MLFINFIMAKAQRTHVNSGLDNSQNKAVTLAGYILYSDLCQYCRVRPQGNW